MQIGLGLRLGIATGLSWSILANLWLLDWWILNAEDLVGHSLPWTMLAIAVCHLAYDVALSCLLVRTCSPHWGKGFVLGALLLAVPGLMFPPSALTPWLSLYGGIQGFTIAYWRTRGAPFDRPAWSKSLLSRQELPGLAKDFTAGRKNWWAWATLGIVAIVIAVPCIR
ncbi:hypothetical protein IV102_12110 [bacterium]|nr:hypothetical protein [bacterium]